jgi:hypothetical protein
MTPEQLDALRTLYKKATPGEWVLDWNVSRLDIFSSDATTLVATLCRSALAPAIDDRVEANAKLIAALHNAFPSLLAAARRGMEAAEDAERYRWLRDNPEHENFPYFDDKKWCFPYLVSGPVGGGVGLRRFESLDAAIDAAREKIK